MYHDIRERLNGHEYLTWAEVRDLHSRGICIGSQTITHPELPRLREPDIGRELGESKRTIEDKLVAPTVEE
jgi:peptidoglycan/xylan/chitin deacetylase (PgdA/CDA1 family)